MVDEPVHYYVDYSSEIKVSRMVQATKASSAGEQKEGLDSRNVD